MRAASRIVLGVVSLAMLARADAQVVRRSQPPLPSGTATLTGIVLTEAGLPVSGAHVTLTAPAFQAKETETDEEGRFTFTNVPEDSVELRASAPAFLEAGRRWETRMLATAWAERERNEIESGLPE